jgi:hypothetical protein
MPGAEATPHGRKTRPLRWGAKRTTSSDGSCGCLGAVSTITIDGILFVAGRWLQWEIDLYPTPAPLKPSKNHQDLAPRPLLIDGFRLTVPVAPKITPFFVPWHRRPLVGLLVLTTSVVALLLIRQAL